MPETDFIGLPEDEERVIRHAFNLGMEAVPDLRYPSRDILVISEWEPYKQLREQTTLFFLFSNETLRSPFQTGELKERGEFYVKQRFGGPYVMFLSYSPYVESDVTNLPAGSIAYYPTYYSSLTGEQVKPSAEFTQLYRSIDAEIKRGASRAECPCIGGGTRVYWVTPKARQALESGAKPAVQGLAFG
jgi:hypothetical protein